MVLVGRPEGKRPLGRPRLRWEDNIKMDLQEVGGGCGGWMELAQDRDRWRALVSTVMNLQVPKMGEFLDWLQNQLASQFIVTEGDIKAARLPRTQEFSNQ